MCSTGKSLALLLIALMATSSLTSLLVNPVNAQSPASKADTSETQTFSYSLNGYSILYGINNNSVGYLIAIYVMDNPPLEISFTERLPNGTENTVTKPIAYGMTIPSASYPTDITFTELTNTPTPTSISTASQTPTSIQTQSPTSTVPELSMIVVIGLLLSTLLVLVTIRYKRY